MRTLLLSFFLVGCGGTESNGVYAGDSSATAPLYDVTGTWTGTWLSRTNIGGTTRASFTQSGTVVEGDISFTNSPCFSAGVFRGTVNGREFSGTVTAGAIRVAMSGTLSPQSLDGTYTALQAGACTGDSGTFSSTR